MSATVPVISRQKGEADLAASIVAAALPHQRPQGFKWPPHVVHGTGRQDVYEGMQARVLADRIVTLVRSKHAK